MKVTKQGTRNTKTKSHSSLVGKKLKNVPSGKTKPRMGNNQNDEHSQKGTDLPKMKHIGLDIVNIISSSNQHDSVNPSTETSVFWPGEGILRQTLLSFAYTAQEEKSLKDLLGKKNDDTATVSVTDNKLPCSSPGPLSPENVQLSFPSRTLSIGTIPSKSLPPGTILTGTLGNIPLVPLPPVTLTSGAFSHGTLPLMSLTSGSLPPVSEIPRPGSNPSLSCSSESSRNVVSTTLPEMGIVTTVPTSFGSNSGTVPILSEVPTYEVPQLDTRSLKVFVPLPNVTSSTRRTPSSPVQTLAASKEGSVTLVYSTVPKIKSSVLNMSQNKSQKVMPLPPMSEMKSRQTSSLHALTRSKMDDTSIPPISNFESGDGDSGATVAEVVPVSSNILSATASSSQRSISMLSTPVSNDSSPGSSTNPITLDDSQDSTVKLSQSDSISDVVSSNSLSFQNNNSQTSDLSPIVVPISNGIAASKADNEHTFSTQDISQIITIPLTSSAIYGHPVISIPFSGNGVSMPVQVSSGMLPMSCSLLPVSNNTLPSTISPTPVTVSETSESLLQTSNSTQSYSGTSVCHLPSDIPGLVTVTSSMVPNTDSLTCVTSVTTTGASGITTPATTSINSVPVASINVSSPSSSTTTTTTTTVFATPNASVEPASSYTMQSPSEILSQLSKAGVLPTMSSSQVSSVLSALGSDTCHLDLESDNSHHAELMTQQQALQLSTSVDKVSTLTQTEDSELGHTVELSCNISMEPRDSKVINVHDIHLSEDTTLLPINLLNNTHERSVITQASVPPDVQLTDKHSSISDIPPVVRTQVTGKNIATTINLRVTDPSGVEPSTLEQLTSIYPQIEPKLNSHCKSNLKPKHGVPKHGGELRSCNSDILLNCEKQVCSVFVKQEELENCINEKGINQVISEVVRDNISKKRKVQDVNEDGACNNGTNTKCMKEFKKHTIKDSYTYTLLHMDIESYTEEVACYKCKFCPFLTLQKKGVTQHVQLVHSVQLPVNEQEPRQNIKCPGCKNVFFTSKSLKVHLSQDHQVVDKELKTLVDIVLKSSFKNMKTRKKLDKKRRKNNVKNHHFEIPNPPVLNESINDRFIPIVILGDVQENHSEVTSEECNKIRVRNLNNETLPELHATPVSTTEVAAVNEVRNEDSLSSSGDVDAREGTLIIDDDKNAKITVEEICDFKLIKTDAEQMVNQGPASQEIVCDAFGQKTQGIRALKPVSDPPLSTRKKRGQTKGAKAELAGSCSKVASNQKVSEKAGYRCDIGHCSVRLRSHDNIEYHRRCHQNDKFHCPECSKQTRSWNGLTTHLWRCHVIDIELYSCDKCSYKTNSFSNLMNLHHRIHGEERPFLCDTCGKGFKNPKQMRNHKEAVHIAKHKQKGNPRGQCDVCGRTFSSSRLLRIHKENVHGKLRPHLCNFCGYSASCRSTLKMHMRQHTGEKPFHCDECNYETADHNSLRRHKMRHTGNKPYKCPHCTYACIQSSTYKDHLNTKHPGMETGFMFSCCLCTFRSVRKDNYLAHMAEHEPGSNPNNRHRKRNGPKSLGDSNKVAQPRETAPILKKSRLPTINISNLITPAVLEKSSLVEATGESPGNGPFIYNGHTVEGLLRQPTEGVEEERFGVEIPSDSVIQLVEELDTTDNNVQNVQSLCVATIETVAEMPLTTDFEAEQITGDIPDIKEPQELKFKVADVKYKVSEEMISQVS